LCVLNHSLPSPASNCCTASPTPATQPTLTYPNPQHAKHPVKQERESELTEMLNSSQASLEAMQKLHSAAQNQLFELQTRSEEVAVGKQVEWEQAAEEVERAQGRMAALEAEKKLLQQRLADQGATGGAGSSALEETLRQELATQRGVAGRLRAELAAARQGVQEVRDLAWCDLREGG